jgi:hypothetical protein
LQKTLWKKRRGEKRRGEKTPWRKNAVAKKRRGEKTLWRKNAVAKKTVVGSDCGGTTRWGLAGLPSPRDRVSRLEYILVLGRLVS